MDGKKDLYLNFVAATAPVSPYKTWIDNYPAITGSDRNPDADPDKDGIRNAIEYVLGSSPNNAADGLDKLPVAAKSGSDFLFTFERAQNTTDATVRIEVGTTTASFPTTYAVGLVYNGGVPEVTYPTSPNIGWTGVKLTVPAGTRNFARLYVDVTLPPP